MNANEREILFGILNKMYSNEVDKKIIYKIIDSGKLIHLKDNDLLFEEGSKSDSMYILINGALLVFKKHNKELRQVGVIKQGESIGEMGLISDEVRSASIYSKRPSTLFKISKENFDYLIRDNWHVMYGLMQQIISRFQKTLNLQVTYSTHIFTVLPISKERDNDQKGGIICRHLEDSLNNIGPSYYLSREIVNELLGIEDINLEYKNLNSSEHYPPLDNLVSNLENDYKYIILQSDSENTSWTEWCLYMGDRFLLTLNANSGINNQEIVDAVNFINNNVPEHLSIERHLLILHDSSHATPQNTKKHLNKIKPIKNHYHLENNRKKDYNRVARIITGNSIGLAFGGGGARGNAHIGVYKAFIENDIPIDIVSGTSAGGIIAGGIASRFSPDDLIKHFKTINDLKMFKEYTLPFSSLIKTNKVLKISKMFAGERQIEDLWLTMFACCVDISAAKLKILDEGPLWEAIWATGALPGILLPVIRDGALLVDGGIANNLPGDILIERYGGKLIAVNVSPEKEMIPSFKEFPNQSRLLLKKIFFKKKFEKEYGTMNIPTLGNILMRAVMASSAHKVKEVAKMSHIFLNPPIEKYGMMDFEAVDELVELGYKYTMNELEKYDLRKLV